MTPDRDELLAYALGILPPARAAQVEAELEHDPALRAELRADLDALALLLEDLDPHAVPVPPDAEAKLLARVRAQEAGVSPAPAHPPRRWPIALALVAALALAFVWLPRPPADPLEGYRRAPGAVERPLRAGGERLGTLVVLPGGRAYVFLEVPPPAERTYQLWNVAGDAPVSLGVFSQGLLVKNLPPGAVLAVSLEPPGGSPQPTATPLFVQRL